jgi:hypothetical protein
VLTKEVAIKAWRFAKAVTPTTNYSDSNQSTLNKIRQDHFVSKLGEEAVYAILSQYGTTTQPDYKIYTAKQKSWEHDLQFENMGVAVKTQLRSSAIRYGLSWTFQAGVERRDKILDDAEAWVFFVECDDTSKHKNLYELYVHPPYQMKELTLGEPKLEYLKGHKLVAYAETLPPYTLQI